MTSLSESSQGEVGDYREKWETTERSGRQQREVGDNREKWETTEGSGRQQREVGRLLGEVDCD